MKTFLFCLMTLPIWAMVHSQNSPFTFTEKGITQDLTARMQMRKVNGMHMQIYREGKLDTTLLMGYADKENKRPITTETLFQIGDMSSAIGNFILLKAASEGKIQLDADVNVYLSSWKLTAAAGEVVTIESLMLNRPHFKEVSKPHGFKPNQKIPSLLQVLKGEKPCKRKAIQLLEGENPDSFDAYSCLVVMQQLIEDIYHMPFAQIAQQEVLTPLEMTASSYNPILTPAQQAIAAVGYTHNGKRLKGDYRQYSEAVASGLWTTPDDYAKFVWHVMRAAKGQDNRFLSIEMAKKAMEAQIHKERTHLFGWGSDNNLYLGGASPGFRTQVQAYPKDNAMIVIFLNSFENWQFLNIDCISAGERYLAGKKKQ